MGRVTSVLRDMTIVGKKLTNADLEEIREQVCRLMDDAPKPRAEKPNMGVRDHYSDIREWMMLGPPRKKPRTSPSMPNKKI
jgi:hypothetical protein